MKLLVPNAEWIHSPDVVRRAHFKPLQLKCASDSGMTIPTTLCSNNKNEIRGFLDAHAQDGVMYQPLLEDAHPLVELMSSTSWPSGPGIFQKKVIMNYAIHVICFRSVLTAEKITPQTPIAEPYHLPVSLAHSIRACMNQLSLVAATFDFASTPNNRFVFMNLRANRTLD